MFLYAEDIQAQGVDHLEAVVASVGRSKLSKVVQEIASSEYDVWRLWPDVKKEWTEEAIRLDKELTKLVEADQSLMWALAMVAFDLQRRNLWSLFDYDSLADYTRSKKLKPATLISYARAERILREVVPEDRRAEARNIGVSVWHLKGKDIRRLGMPIVETMLQLLQQGVPDTSIIAMIEEQVPIGETATGKPRYEVTLNLKSVRFVIGVNAHNREAAEEKAMKQFLAYKALERYKMIDDPEAVLKGSAGDDT